MTIDPVTGVISWSAVAGTYQVRVKVTDQIGRFATQAYRLRVATVLDNLPPVFISRPVVLARSSYPYTYPSRATDPNLADTVIYSLETAPSGMTVERASGVVRWAPSSAGSYPVTLVATDLAGAEARQSFTVDVTENLPPVIASAPRTRIRTGLQYLYQVRAADPEGGAITYRLVAGPAGMTLSSLGELRWGGSTVVGTTASVSLEVADPTGLTATQLFSIEVVVDEPPVITSLPPGVASSGGSYRYQVVAVDFEDAALTYGLDVAPPGMTVSGTGEIRWSPTEVGLFNVTVRATDSAGLFSTQSFTVDVGTTPVVDQDVTVRLENIPTFAELLVPTQVRATITGTNGITIERWDATLVREPDDGTVIPLGGGTGGLLNGILGTVDTTLLSNDGWVVRVRVLTPDAEVTREFPILVRGELKLGNFRTSVTDLTIPVTGIPLSIGRTYDTLDLTKGEFGYGWRLSLPGRVVDTPKETGEGMKTGDKVYVTLPGGRRVGFTFRPYPSGGLFLRTWTPLFVPDKGVHDAQLEITGAPLLLQFGGEFFDFDEPFNPDTYVLTLKNEGLRVTVKEGVGTIEVTDRNKNRVTLLPGSLQHSNGTLLPISRDAEGRNCQRRFENSPIQPV
jgi:hypothetical protein